MNGARPGPVSPCMDTNTDTNTDTNMNHRITKKALKALVDHAGDELRENLACIFASTDGSVLAATDGTALLLRHDPMAGEGGMVAPETSRPGRTLNLDACKRAIKLCAAKGRMEIDAASATITVYEPHDVSSVVLDASRPGHEPGSWDAERDGFPPYTQVIPGVGLRSDGPPSLYMSPALMVRMFSALMPRHTKNSAVRLGFGLDSRDPVRVDVEAGTPGMVDDCAWIGVLMPTSPA